MISPGGLVGATDHLQANSPLVMKGMKCDARRYRRRLGKLKTNPRAFTKNVLGNVRYNVAAGTCIRCQEATMVQKTINWQRSMNEFQSLFRQPRVCLTYLLQ